VAARARDGPPQDVRGGLRRRRPPHVDRARGAVRGDGGPPRREAGAGPAHRRRARVARPGLAHPQAGRVRGAGITAAAIPTAVFWHAAPEADGAVGRGRHEEHPRVVSSLPLIPSPTPAAAATARSSHLAPMPGGLPVDGVHPVVVADQDGRQVDSEGGGGGPPGWPAGQACDGGLPLLLLLLLPVSARRRPPAPRPHGPHGGGAVVGGGRQE